MANTVIENPVLRGFNPDPVIFRDDDMYYLVVSTFEWLPGLRVYASKDMTNWHYETSILDESSGVDLRGNQICCSIWAPNVVYRNGTYYVVYSNVNQTKVPYKDVDNFVITATDIHGPWSEPTYINSSGFDPSLFFDDDGSVYFLNEIWDYRRLEHNKSAGIVMQRIDPDTFELFGQAVRIFEGTSARKTEAPQLYNHDGWYYLLTAEGGTEEGHQETVARSRDIWGPYEVDPKTPLISASDDPDWPLQCDGHASLVSTDNDEWYIAHLCTRPYVVGASILGRETAIQKVKWTEDGWLRLMSGGHKPEVAVNAPVGVDAYTPMDTGFHDDLCAHLPKGRYWSALRTFPDNSWLVSTDRGLRISGGQSPQSTFEQHMIATRQTEFNCDIAVDMAYTAQNYLQLAGLTLYLDIANYVLFMVTADDDVSQVIVLQQCVAGKFSEVRRCPINESSKRLRIAIRAQQASFAVTDIEGDEALDLGDLDIGFLAGGFTGNFIGLDVIDMNRRNASSALFSDFEYRPQHTHK